MAGGRGVTVVVVTQEREREREGERGRVCARWCKGARSLSATVEGPESRRLKGQKRATSRHYKKQLPAWALILALLSFSFSHSFFDLLSS